MLGQPPQIAQAGEPHSCPAQSILAGPGKAANRSLFPAGWLAELAGESGCPRAARGWRSPRLCLIQARACARSAAAAPSARRTTSSCRRAPASNADSAPAPCLADSGSHRPGPFCQSAQPRFGWGHVSMMQLQCNIGSQLYQKGVIAASVMISRYYWPERDVMLCGAGLGA